jgi:hypothetical protein
MKRDKLRRMRNERRRLPSLGVYLMMCVDSHSLLLQLQLSYVVTLLPCYDSSLTEIANIVQQMIEDILTKLSSNTRCSR